MKTINIGLCRSRHAMPERVKDYIFPTIVEDVMDFDSLADRAEKGIVEILGKYGCMDVSNYHDGFEPSKDVEIHLYITGLTPCLIAVLNYCLIHQVKLTCYHYDTDIQEYRPQRVLTSEVVNEKLL